MRYLDLLKPERKKSIIFPIFVIGAIIFIAQLPIPIPMRWYVGIGSFAILLIVSDILSIKLNPRMFHFFIIWILLGLVIIISAAINESNRQILSGIWFLIFVPLVYFLAVPKFVTNNILIIPVSLFISSLSVLLWSLITNPISTGFVGVYENPNQMGMLCASLFAATLFLLLGLVKRINFINFFLIIVGFGTFLATILTKSRTSTISIVLMFLTFFYFYINQSNKKIGVFFTFFVFCLFASIIGFYLIFTFTGYDIQTQIEKTFSGIKEKTELSIERDIILTGRYEKKWLPVVNEMQILGHGEHYFGTGTDDYGIKGSAHSSFINFLGSYGIIAALIYIYIIILGFYHAYKYYKREYHFNKYAPGPLIIMVGIVTLSMAENVINVYGNGITIAYFMIYGFVLNSNFQDKSKIIKTDMG
ncbi:MAG: O-antigen ligase family protein [Planctomycetes bacterium]|nr:O-antigen ligase family protein [Planctomycetota bacterium]